MENTFAARDGQKEWGRRS